MQPWESVVTELVATRGDALQRYAMLLCGSREQAADRIQGEAAVGPVRPPLHVDQAAQPGGGFLDTANRRVRERARHRHLPKRNEAAGAASRSTHRGARPYWTM